MAFKNNEMKKEAIESGERNLFQCKQCLDHRIRIRAGKFNSTAVRWLDERGKTWNGKLCPDCNNNRMKNHMSGKRVDSEGKDDETTPNA